MTFYQVNSQTRKRKINDDETDENSSPTFVHSTPKPPKPLKLTENKKKPVKEPQYDSATDNHKFTFEDDGPNTYGIRYRLLEEILLTRPSFMIPGYKYNNHWTQESPGFWNH